MPLALPKSSVCSFLKHEAFSINAFLPIFAAASFFASYLPTRSAVRNNYYLAFLVLFHPLTSIVVVGTLAYIWFLSGIVVKIALGFVCTLMFLFLGPHATRNSELWHRLASERRGSIQLGDYSIPSVRSVVVVSFTLVDRGLVDHALAYARADLIAQRWSACLCDVSSWHPFWFPMARVALWLMGGLVEYNHAGLRQQLDKRRNVVAVVLEGHMGTPIAEADVPVGPVTDEAYRSRSDSTNSNSSCGGDSHEATSQRARADSSASDSSSTAEETPGFSVRSGSIFSTALRANAILVPALVDSQGYAHFGKPIYGPSETNSIPSVRELRAVIKAFYEELNGMRARISPL